MRRVGSVAAPELHPTVSYVGRNRGADRQTRKRGIAREIVFAGEWRPVGEHDAKYDGGGRNFNHNLEWAREILAADSFIFGSGSARLFFTCIPELLPQLTSHRVGRSRRRDVLGSRFCRGPS